MRVERVVAEIPKAAPVGKKIGDKVVEDLSIDAVIFNPEEERDKSNSENNQYGKPRNKSEKEEDLSAENTESEDMTPSHANAAYITSKARLLKQLLPVEKIEEPKIDLKA